MKNSKFKSILSCLATMLVVVLLVSSCSKEEIVPIQMEEVKVEEASNMDANQRNPFLYPCYPTSGEPLPNVTSSYECSWVYDGIWFRGKCWICY